MKIESPLRNLDEVIPLLEAGADIFYCGVIGDRNINNRNNSVLHQFYSFDELKEAISIIHKHKKEIYLTLNATDANLDKCMNQAKQAIDSGIDGIIAADLRFIKELNIRYPSTSVILSCLTGINNRHCLDFYSEPNVKGYCFERNISIENMRNIIHSHPELMAVAFVSGNCNNTQLICQLHNLPTYIPIHKHEGGYGEMICESWHLRKDSDEDSHISCMLTKKNGCALCALFELKEAGISALKIEGRSLDLKYKLQKVSLYKEALECMDKAKDKEEYIRTCKLLYKREFGIYCTPYHCFYNS